MDENEVTLAGMFVAVESTRFTPAGVPVTEFRLRHASRQIEAGMPVSVECEMQGVAMGALAAVVAQCGRGATVRIRGFLSRRSRTSSQLVLHASSVDQGN